VGERRGTSPIGKPMMVPGLAVALVVATVVAWFLPAAHGTVSEELKAEAKVTYSKVLPCVLDSWMMRRRPNATFAFPDDADEHYQDLIKKMGRFRQAKVWRGGFCNPRPHHTDLWHARTQPRTRSSPPPSPAALHPPPLHAGPRLRRLQRPVDREHLHPELHVQAAQFLPRTHSLVRPGTLRASSRPEIRFHPLPGPCRALN
jgi:hypothetical protein